MKKFTHISSGWKLLEKITGDHVNDIQTLCWDCANATGKCPWSEELIPVKGWTAVPTKHKSTVQSSFIVFECPLFERDAYRYGLKRYRPEDENEAV